MVSVSSVSAPRWTYGLAQIDDEELLRMMQGTNEATVLLKSTVLKESASIPSTLRALYDAREPLGTNIELWNLMNAVSDVASDPGLTCESCHGQVVLDLTGKPIFDLLSDIIISGELFEDWPGWVRCVLRLTSKVVDLAFTLREVKCTKPGCTCERRMAYLRGVESTDSGVTAAQLAIKLLEQAFEHRHIFVEFDAHSWQYQYLAQVPDILRDDLLYLLESVAWLKHIKSGHSREYARLCFLCWYYDRHVDIDIDRPRRTDQILRIANQLLECGPFLGENCETITSFSREYVQVHFEPMHICSRLRETITRTKTLSADVATLCIFATYFLPSTVQCISYVLETSLLQAMCACLDLPLGETTVLSTTSSAREDSYSSLRNCLKGIMGVILFALNDLPFARGATVLIEECKVPLALSWVIRLSLFYPTSGPNVDTLRHAICVTDLFTQFASSGVLDKKSALHSIFRHALSCEWYPTLMLLRTAKSSLDRDTNALVSWKKLGAVMGLDEKVEQKLFTKREGKCCSLVVCRYHTAEPPTGLRTCAGCGEVRYHSKACQSEDWKRGGHKARCKRIK
ncbi:hypothetical protein PENSPDRAFT_757914 [Peniophora sp. CONT]|nr:hypothetical protein PENSPDRAFT_757914 [Peniophora sp. CONT]